ncbi:MAG TPA: hypothetical protein VK896_10210, partial [Gaiellaceae bacterium]|nr:hypothetical protein [Gaiellaceae bacterium]
GLLALVPLVVQPARGAARRGLQAVAAVLAAVFVAGVSSGEAPIAGGDAGSLGIGPRDSAGEVAATLWGALAGQPTVLLAALVAAVVAAGLARLRELSPYALGAVALALVAAGVLAGAGVVSALVVAGVWIAVALASFHRGR